MKKLLIGFLMLFSLIPAVSADNEGTDPGTDETSGVVETGDEGETNPGITPDSIFYFFDKAIENLDLALTFDDEAKVEKFIQYAEERLAEAEAMEDADKQEYIEELILEYLENIEEASDGLLDVDDEAAEDLEGDLDEAIAESDEIAESLPEDLYEKLEAKKGQAYIKFTVLKEAIGSTETDVVAMANEAGLGLGELAQIASGADMLGQDFVDTLQGVIDAGSVEAYFAELGLKVSDLVSNGVNMKQAKIQERMEAAIESGNEKKAENAERQMANAIAVEEMKNAFDEIKDKKEAALVEAGVEDMDDLSEEERVALQEELKADRKEAIEEKREVIQEKQAEMKEANAEAKEARENGNSGNNGNASEDKSNNGKANGKNS